MKRNLETIQIKDIPCEELHFQYVPGRFNREVYGGNDDDMLLVRHSPHYSFLKEYQRIGRDVLKTDSDYYKMHSLWNRERRWIEKKMDRFINLYEDIKKNGHRDKIIVVEEPLYEKKFDSGYEIYDGHHRASICAVLGHDKVSCKIVKIV